jgi:hypothetical protein
MSFFTKKWLTEKNVVAILALSTGCYGLLQTAIPRISAAQLYSTGLSFSRVFHPERIGNPFYSRKAKRKNEDETRSPRKCF